LPRSRDGANAKRWRAWSEPLAWDTEKGDSSPSWGEDWLSTNEPSRFSRKRWGLDGSARPEHRSLRASNAKMRPSRSQPRRQIPPVFGAMFKQSNSHTHEGVIDEFKHSVHSAGGGGQRWGTPVLTGWPMKVDARLKTWEAPDEQTVDARIQPANKSLINRRLKSSSPALCTQLETKSAARAAGEGWLLLGP
jgi:hypothetical protein